MKIIKKGSFDICSGDCENCAKRGMKNLSLLTIAVKKKVVTKYVPPDMAAIKLALEIDSGGVRDIKDMTDGELIEYERKLRVELGLEEEGETTMDEE